MKNTTTEPNSDLLLWKTLGDKNKLKELGDFKPFGVFAEMFISEYDEKLEQANELYNELKAMIDFGYGETFEDYEKFINPYTKYIQLVIELEAGLSTYDNLIEMLCIQKTHEDYPCNTVNLELSLQYTHSSVKKILDSDIFLHFAQEYRNVLKE